MSYDRLAMQMSVVTICLLLLISTAGCHPYHYHAPSLDEARRDTRNVAVIAASYAPERNATILDLDRSLSGGDIALITTFVILAPLAKPGTTPTLGTSIKEYSTEDANAIVVQLQPVIEDASIQEKLAEQVASNYSVFSGRAAATLKGVGPKIADEAPDYRSLVKENRDLVIETRVDEEKFFGYVKDKVARAELWIRVKARVIRPHDGMSLHQDQYAYDSNLFPVSEWADRKALLTQLRTQAYADISERIAEDVAFGSYLSTGSCAWLPERDYVMLRPFGPAMPKLSYPSRLSYDTAYDVGDVLPVDSLRPVFVWQAFPRDRDLRAENGKDLANITSVAYDLRIWKVFTDHIDLVYDKRGITAVNSLRKSIVTPIEGCGTGATKELPPVTINERVAEYALDVALEPAATYLWSVRARFVRDDQTILTPWSSLRMSRDLRSEENEMVPNRLHPSTSLYIFKTPGAVDAK
jgi:hypothetical protein